MGREGSYFSVELSELLGLAKLAPQIEKECRLLKLLSDREAEQQIGSGGYGYRGRGRGRGRGGY